MTLKKLQEIAEETIASYCKKYKLRSITIKVKNLKGGGRCRYKTRFISIPIWSYLQGGIGFFKAYIIHEIIHFVMRDNYCVGGGHGNRFISMEIRLLKEIGLVPLKYRRAYYNKLEDKNGKILWRWAEYDRNTEGLKPYLLKE